MDVERQALKSSGSTICGVIEFEPPRGWIEIDHNHFDTHGNRWTVTFRCQQLEDVFIFIHYRGYPVEADVTVLLRALLDREPLEIYNRMSGVEFDCYTTRALSTVLGNAADNQTVNGGCGHRTPVYRLDMLRTATLKGRGVLLMQGAYVTPKSAMVSIDYAVLIDAFPESTCAEIEEIHLHAPPGISHEPYVKSFQQMLESLIWLPAAK